ncbi:MAG: methyltransferase domain-containing protein [Thermodesulfovibrionales bacterium]
MNLTPLHGPPDFWNRFAPWYEKWLSRGAYHFEIMQELGGMVEPGWRILDVGAGTGALAIPLSSLGCFVRALEPSAGMRDFLSAKLYSFGIENARVLAQRWEDFQMEEETDLLVACNSLHLTAGGISGGMHKAFSSGAEHVALITEINQGIPLDFREIDALQSGYDFLFIKNHRVDSSFHFESMDEVEELQHFLDREILVHLEDGCPVQRDSTDVAVVWWEKRKSR